MLKPRDILLGRQKKENGEAQRYSWGRQKKNGEAQRYSWEGRRRRIMVKPRDIAGKAEEEEEW